MTDTAEITVEVIDARELARHWKVPESWVRNHTRQGFVADPIPHKKLGRYTRFEWGSPKLKAWWERRDRLPDGGLGAHRARLRAVG
jgi:hypothetical protein